MSETARIEIPVEAATAAALMDDHRLAAVGRLVDRMVRPGGDDPLIALLAQTAIDGGLSTEEVDAELAIYNAERRS